MIRPRPGHGTGCIDARGFLRHRRRPQGGGAARGFLRHRRRPQGGGAARGFLRHRRRPQGGGAARGFLRHRRRPQGGGAVRGDAVHCGKVFEVAAARSEVHLGGIDRRFRIPVGVAEVENAVRTIEAAAFLTAARAVRAVSQLIVPGMRTRAVFVGNRLRRVGTHDQERRCDNTGTRRKANSRLRHDPFPDAWGLLYPTSCHALLHMFARQTSFQDRSQGSSAIRVGRLLGQFDRGARPLRRRPGAGRTQGVTPIRSRSAAPREAEPVGERSPRTSPPPPRTGRGRGARSTGTAPEQHRAAGFDELADAVQVGGGQRRHVESRPHRPRCAATASRAARSAQLCSATSALRPPPTHSASSPAATDSSTGCTGLVRPAGSRRSAGPPAPRAATARRTAPLRGSPTAGPPGEPWPGRWLPQVHR